MKASQLLLRLQVVEQGVMMEQPGQTWLETETLEGTLYS